MIVNSGRRKIIIDTDPGQDDAAAILLALASPEICVLGVTTVAGNVPLELTARNARIVCELADRRDIPVFKGAEAPLKRGLVTAEHVHGVTGLDGPVLSEPTMALQDEHAVNFIIRTVMENDRDEITLCVLGPQTNIALALAKAPEIAGRIREIVFMGGGLFAGGNITPAAEFNIFVDPEAASLVVASGIPQTMMPLDVTHQVMATRQRVARIAAIGSETATALADMLLFYERFDEEKYGSDGGPLHDPCVIAYLIEPGLFSGRHCNVEVETVSELTRGMTVIDWWGVTNRAKNVQVMGKADSDGFFELLTSRIAAAFG